MLFRSTVSAVIVKWKRLGATTAQPRSGRPHKRTERDRRVLKRIALTAEFQTASGSNISTITVLRELHEMGLHSQAPHRSLRSPCSIPSVGWSGVKLAGIGLWSSGNTISGVMNHTSPSGNPLDKSRFGGTRRMLPSPTHSINCKVWRMRNNDLGLFFIVWAKPLSSSERKS